MPTCKDKQKALGRDCIYNIENTDLTPGRRQSQILMLSTNVDQKSLETEFRLPFVARLATHSKRKHCNLAIFDPRSSIVQRVFDCRLPGMDLEIGVSGVYLHLLYFDTNTIRYSSPTGSFNTLRINLLK